MICQKCGSENQEGKKFCGECGTKLNKGNITSSTINKKIIILSIIALLILLGSAFGVYSYNKYQDELQYENDLKNVVAEISDQSTKIKAMIGIYSDKRLYETTKRSLASLSIGVSGVEEAGISSQKEEFEKDGTMDKIKKAKSNIQLKMRLLNQPAQKYKEAYNMAFELYTNYSEYESIIESSSILGIFGKKTEDLYLKMTKDIDKLQIKIPNAK